MSGFLSNADFDLFRKVIYAESGITFCEANRPILDNRLKDRLRDKGLSSVQEYYKLITSDGEEMKVLLDSVTTNLTRFFRNQPHFDAFQYYVVPRLVEQKQDSSDKKIRVWSAGCSTGEEPYTIAMILKDILPPSYSFEIMASDISLKSLMVGQQGGYSESRIAGVPQKYLQRFFTKTSDGYQVNADIMRTIRFDYHNLKHVPSIHDLDIVFCRNVLIYFDEAAQLEVINHFWNAMAPHSYLYIGHSESLFGMQTKFEFLKTEWSCLYQKNV